MSGMFLNGVESWDAQMVSDYVKITFPEYSQIFFNEKIDGLVFLSLTIEDLGELDIINPTHKKEIIGLISSLKSNNEESKLAHEKEINTLKRKRPQEQSDALEKERINPIKKQKITETALKIVSLINDDSEDIDNLIVDLEENKKKQIDDDMKLAQSLAPVYCAICMCDTDFDFIQPLEKCSHKFCRDCLEGYYKRKIDSRDIPILCPECRLEVSDRDLENMLTKEYLDKFEKYALNSIVMKNPNNFSCCMTANCDYLFFFEKGKDSDFKCPTCKKRYCLKCKVDYHTNSTCEKYQQWCIANGQADELTKDFMEGQNFKSCPHCKKWIEKARGCDHMTCLCGYEFCYKCGGKYMACECMGNVGRRVLLTQRGNRGRGRNATPRLVSQLSSTRNSISKRSKKKNGKKTAKKRRKRY